MPRNTPSLCEMLYGNFVGGLDLHQVCEENQVICNHIRLSSTHFLRFLVFRPSSGTLPVSGYSGIRGSAQGLSRYSDQRQGL